MSASENIDSLAASLTNSMRTGLSAILESPIRFAAWVNDDDADSDAAADDTMLRSDIQALGFYLRPGATRSQNPTQLWTDAALFAQLAAYVVQHTAAGKASWQQRVLMQYAVACASSAIMLTVESSQAALEPVDALAQTVDPDALRDLEILDEVRANGNEAE